MDKERWVPVDGLEDQYEVSDLGRVRSLLDNQRRARKTPLILSVNALDSSGYPIVCLRGQCKGIHRLVAHAFLGPKPAGQEICHNDSDKRNNRVSNLRYDTKLGNSADVDIQGRRPRGAKNGKCKLSEADVLSFVAMHRSGKTPKEISSSTGVNLRTLHAILYGDNWSWLTGIESNWLHKRRKYDALIPR